MLRYFITLSVTATLACTSLLANEKINGAGASFPAPLYYDWAYNYQKNTHIRVNYQSIGSGGGINQAIKRIVDFGATDKPLTDTELHKNNLLQFPVIIGSIVVGFHIAGIQDNDLKLKNSVLADIYAGKITMWNDPAIIQDNNNIQLPNKKIVVIHRSDGSGTTYIFSNYLNESSEFWKNNYGIGKVIDWACGIGAKGNEGVANLLQQTPYSIGYIESAYKQKNNITTAQLTTATGKWVSANARTFKASAHHNWIKSNNLNTNLTLQKCDDCYPIIAASFILLPKEKTQTNKNVISFFDYAFKNGDKSAQRLGYITLPNETKAMIQKYWMQQGIK